MEVKILFRLCHNCNCLNESETEILRCQTCGKGFLPLNYFEKLRQKSLQLSQATSAEQAAKIINFNPIHGLIVFW